MAPMHNGRAAKGQFGLSCANRGRSMDTRTTEIPPEIRTRERRVFAFLTVVFAPLMAMALVGTYGLLIWIFQMLAGPPAG